MKIKMNRNIITNVFVGIAITALIGGFLFGIFNKKEEKEVSPNDENKEVISYVGNEQKEQNNEVEENENIMNEENKDNEEDLHGENYILDIPEKQEIDESLLAKPYEDVLEKKLTKETKKLTKDFIKVFYNLDGRYPKKYIDESKKFMTNDLYESLLKNHEVPTHNNFNRKYISAEISESKEFNEKMFEEFIPYIIHVKGEFTDVKGENKREITDVYTILLIDDNGKYKVNDVYKNNYFQ